MGQDCFDALTRLLSHDATRRVALGRLLAAGLGSALAVVGIDGASAACTDLRAKCRGGGECCGKKGEVACDRISRLCDRNRLRRGQRCCRTNGARCKRSCDCCDPLVCVSNTCQRPTT